MTTPLPGQPAQAGSQAATTGTARIGGRIVAADGHPLRAATVSAYCASAKKTYWGRADETGRYAIKDLPAGSFELRATKPGYVAMTYGARKPNGPSRPVELSTGQDLETIDIVLPSACIISGRVLDEFGEPAVQVSVEPLTAVRINGTVRTAPASFNDETDDRGIFRIDSLEPGQYILAASVPSAPRNIRILDTTNYTRSFYPGGSSLSQAQPIVCHAGEEVGGVEFALARMRTARVSGRVFDSEGKAGGRAGVELMPKDDMTLAGALRAVLQPDGTFTIAAVPPGDYNLMVLPFASSPGVPREFAWRRVTVSGRDVTNLVLTTTRGATVRGSVTSASGSFDFPLTQLALAPAFDIENMVPVGTARATVKADGSFELKGVAGRRRLNILGYPDTWTVQSIRLRDQDVTDTLIDFDAADEVGEVEVVLTKKMATVAGSVVDERGHPVADCAVGIFAEDPELRYPQSRFSRVIRPDEAATFQVKALPPGRYFAVALPDIDQDQWMDTDKLERLTAIATRFAIGEGETATLTLKLQTDPGRP